MFARYERVSENSEVFLHSALLIHILVVTGNSGHCKRLQMHTTSVSKYDSSRVAVLRDVVLASYALCLVLRCCICLVLISIVISCDQIEQFCFSLADLCLSCLCFHVYRL